MTLWMTWLAVLWPIAATITPILIAVGLLWLRTKFADIKTVTSIGQDIHDINARLDIIDLRLGKHDHDLDEEPTRLQVLQKIGEVSERLSRVEANGTSLQREIGQQIKGLSDQLKTQGQYIHTIIERGME